jgi:hypothetical protein
MQIRNVILAIGWGGLMACGQAAPTTAEAVGDGAAGSHDASSSFCDAPLGSAHVTATREGAATTFDRLHAGGIWLIGPVAPPGSVAAAPMSAVLLFTEVDHLDASVAACCDTPNSACCHVDGVVARIASLPAGGELGTFAADVGSFLGPDLPFPGMVTITSFVSPFPNAPGRIAGSISATSGNANVVGTFDHSFCRELLGATI